MYRCVTNSPICIAVEPTENEWDAVYTARLNFDVGGAQAGQRDVDDTIVEGVETRRYTKNGMLLPCAAGCDCGRSQ